MSRDRHNVGGTEEQKCIAASTAASNSDDVDTGVGSLRFTRSTDTVSADLRVDVKPEPEQSPEVRNWHVL